MRRLPAVAAVLVLLVAALPAAARAAYVPRSSPRLHALAAQLRTGPLAVDPDAAWLLPGSDRHAVAATLRAARIPFHVAVLPLLREDESGGDGRAAAVVLAREVGRPGVYVTVDTDGNLDAVTVRVPRELGFRFEHEVPEPGFGSVADLRVPQRLAALVRLVDDAPPAAPASGGGEYLSPILPVHYRPDRPGSVAGDLLLAALLGAGGAGLVAWPLRRRAVRTSAAARAIETGRPARRRRGRR